MISAHEALDQLRQGNKRFATAARRHSTHTGTRHRVELPKAQSPFAIVLGCADSRVPPEMIFDQGLGDLFVVRVGGNIAGPSQIGSIEFGASQFGSRLVVVLGHSGCGAVRATIDHLIDPAPAPPGLGSLVDAIMPSVQSATEGQSQIDPDEIMPSAVRANAAAAVAQLRGGSPVLDPLIAEDGLVVVGAEYSLADGTVDFFDVPAP